MHSVFLPDQPWLPANSTGREFLLAVAGSMISTTIGSWSMSATCSTSST